MAELRIPPQNLEAEKAVLSAVIIDTEAINKVLDVLTPDSFYDPRHGLIFDAIMQLVKDNRSLDILTLTEQLKKNKKLSQAGGASYLSEILVAVPTSANIAEYASIVKDKAIRRHLIQFSGKLDEMSRKESVEIEELVDEIEKNVLKVSEGKVGDDFYDTHKLLEMQMERADLYAKDPDALRGIASGLNEFDKILGGLHRSDLIILAARPSVGKSALAIHLARYAAVHEHKSVAFFALEMPAVQLMERMLAQQMEVDLWNIRMGKLKDAEHKRYPEAAGKLGDAKIFINDTPGISIIQLKSKVRRLALEQGVDMIIIDYLQLMQTRDIDNRAQAVGEISRSLKILARELDVPIIALSQLNRAVENRSDRIPQLSDLRESGAIEQDADVVIFLSRDIMDDENVDDENKKKIDVVVAKHRNGATGRFVVNLVSNQQRFENA